MTIPEAAIEAAADGLAEADTFTFEDERVELARAAIEAAMPAIREAIAQEIEADPGKWPGEGHSPEAFQSYAARVVRGRTTATPTLSEAIKADAQAEVLEEAADQLAQTTNLSAVVMGLRKKAAELRDAARIVRGGTP